MDYLVLLAKLFLANRHCLTAPVGVCTVLRKGLCERREAPCSSSPRVLACKSSSLEGEVEHKLDFWAKSCLFAVAPEALRLLYFLIRSDSERAYYFGQNNNEDESLRSSESHFDETVG